MCFLSALAFVAKAQYPSDDIKPVIQPVFSRYNAVTLGSQLGSSVTSTAKSYVLYNFNQISISDRVYTTSYSEYYKDENNYFLSHYLTAQVFLSYKVQPLFIMGLGRRLAWLTMMIWSARQLNTNQNLLFVVPPLTAGIGIMYASVR